MKIIMCIKGIKMYRRTDFKISNQELKVKKDTYPMSRIVSAEARALTWRDNAGRIIFWGFLLSYAIWFAALLVLEDYPLSVTFPGFILGAVLFSVGAIYGLSQCGKYELRIEFKHSDETGIQWVSVAKGRRKEEFKLFQEQANKIAQAII
ncbi:DUF6232 family protein [Photobacterium sp. SDRW27]|uniref:DUF6232 family protein n=1 Tax=Photobacterium obscurum TaxID=2829490 RepID=UPI002243B003|nr:DUF6232 family protein [Photobacterium obscurum]MCW8330169.1 DUF6232 family protein [Photobacterium obscurum]